MPNEDNKDIEEPMIIPEATGDSLEVSPHQHYNSDIMDVESYDTSYTASDRLRVSADAIKSTTGGWTKLKEIQILIGGTIRNSFELASSSAGTSVDARTYLDGVEKQPSGSNNTETYVKFTGDITVPTGGGLIQLYAAGSAPVSAYVRNFRLYWSTNKIPKALNYNIITN